MDVMTRPLRAAGLAAFFAAALVVATAPTASAHAAYKDSTPGDGETVSSPPAQVTAEFTEPITDSSYLEVYDPCGQRVDGGDSQVSGYNMSISMSAARAGEYVVEFAAQSIDTHVTYGSFSFTSSGGEPCPGEEPAETGTGGGGGAGAGSAGGGGAAGGGSGSPSAPGGGAGPASGGAAGGRHAQHRKETGDARPGRDGGGPRAPGARNETVTLENTGDRAPDPGPAAWDLPLGAVFMALVLCVLIGAAGGRVYAGIVAPPRR
ncbi:MAG: copper resistance protein CopC [Actinomycetota bacterium]